MPVPPALIPASAADRPVIDRLMQLCLYDMASDRPFPIGPDGRYDYGFLDAFWDHPYLFQADGQIAGFALVIRHCPVTGTAPCWFMAEFFILRSFRRRALGQTMLQAILTRHPGRWHIANQTVNTAADAFWSRVIPSDGRTTRPVHFDGDDWIVRAFEAPSASLPRALRP
jgi:predicted acetyltransferase